MPKSDWMVVRRNAETGRTGGFTYASGLTTASVIEYLHMITGRDAAELVFYAVGDPDTLPELFMSAEIWLVEHTAAYVVAAWTAGAPAARTARQNKLREWWPALGEALDSLAANDA